MRDRDAEWRNAMIANDVARTRAGSIRREQSQEGKCSLDRVLA